MTQQQPDEDAIRHIFRLAEQDIRGVVRSEQNAQALADHYRVLANRQREEITAREKEIARLQQDLADATEANRTYAKTLARIREVLGADDDADLVEEAERLRTAHDASLCLSESYVQEMRARALLGERK